MNDSDDSSANPARPPLVSARETAAQRIEKFAQPETDSPGEALQLTWDNAQGSILGLSLFNWILRILTLGVYHFWGKTEVRKRIWSSARIQGEPLEYTGTGRELFTGFVIVFFVIMLPLALISFAIQIFVTSKATAGFMSMALYALFFLLIGIGSYRARRYRLSRTRWRGIRGSLTAGRSFRYGLLYFGTGLLIPLTLGWIIPWREARLQRFVTNETKLGNHPLRFTGRAWPLYRRFWAVWLTAIIAFYGGFATLAVLYAQKFAPLTRGKWPTLGAADYAIIIGVVFTSSLIYSLIKAWYNAGLINYFAAETWYGRARFRGSATATSLVWLTLTNTLLTLLTLGILAPLAQSRFMNYYITRLDFDGNVPLERVGQNDEEMMTRGEGLATAFDIDAFG